MLESPVTLVMCFFNWKLRLYRVKLQKSASDKSKLIPVAYGSYNMPEDH